MSQSTETSTLSTQHFPLSTLLPSLHPGQLTLLIGEPGVGKSLLATDLAARLTNNAAPPPHPPTPREIPPDQIPDHLNPADFQPASVFFLSSEDSQRTLESRFRAASTNNLLLHVGDLDDNLIPPPLEDYHPHFSREKPQPSPLLAWLMLEMKNAKNPRLIVLDSLPSFLGTHDCTNPASIREILHPLLSFADYRNIALLGLTHLNKTPPRKIQSPLHRILGSQAYPALARSILHLAPHPNNPNLRILTHLKNNLGPLHPPLAFTIQSPTNPSPGIAIPEAPSLTWLSNLQTDAANIPPTLPSNTPDPFTQSQLELALHFLKTTLAQGPLPSSQLLKQARSLSLSQRTLFRARSQLQTHCYLDPTSHQWHISLPQSQS